MIAVENLSKEFGHTHAVRGVSFAVQPGEIIGLLGPNGSGKTTIMRILTGFFPPTSGRAFVAGIDVTQSPLLARQRVGYLPESAVLYPDMRVHQFLDFCADVRRMSGAYRKERLERVVHDCGLTDVKSRLIGKLSKGYRQRVGLAQAILHEPEVLILDEPTVGLDPKQIIEIRQLIRSLRGRTTILLSTHILPEAATMCERVVILHRGRIVAEDTAEELTRRLQGGDRTFVRAVASAEDLHALLSTIPGVVHLERHEESRDDSCAFVASTDGPVVVSDLIAAAIVARGWGLLELRPVSMTLEDLFVRLVSNNDSEAA